MCERACEHVAGPNAKPPQHEYSNFYLIYLQINFPEQINLSMLCCVCNMCSLLLIIILLMLANKTGKRYPQKYQFTFCDFNISFGCSVFHTYHSIRSRTASAYTRREMGYYVCVVCVEGGHLSNIYLLYLTPHAQVSTHDR